MLTAWDSTKIGRSQRDMTAYITDAYNEGGVVLLEAGTGVGKSFAYLVPALAWAQANGERTVVSTNTINLQEQLVGQGPAASAARAARPNSTRRPSPFSRAGGTISASRLHAADRRPAITARAGQATTRSAALPSGLATLPTARWPTSPVPPTPEVWDEVSAEADLCTRLQCPHFEPCFLFRARRMAAEADIVVVNHHLLSADLAVRQVQDNWTEAAVLPPYRRLILDEAHHLEDVAASHLGIQVSSRGLRRLLATTRTQRQRACCRPWRTS